MLGWRVREAFLANRSGDPCIATAESAGFCEKEHRIGRLGLKLRDFWREGLGCGDCQRQGQILGTLADVAPFRRVRRRDPVPAVRLSAFRLTGTENEPRDLKGTNQGRCMRIASFPAR